MNKADPLMLYCGTHGERASAVVCKHMLRNEPAPSGFIENSSDPEDLQAWCYRCEEKFEQEGEMTDAFRAFNDMALVCIDCYKEAKARHSLPSN
jgi:hypothetical protein